MRPVLLTLTLLVLATTILLSTSSLPLSSGTASDHQAPGHATQGADAQFAILDSVGFETFRQLEALREHLEARLGVCNAGLVLDLDMLLNVAADLKDRIAVDHIRLVADSYAANSSALCANRGRTLATQAREIQARDTAMAHLRDASAILIRGGDESGWPFATVQQFSEALRREDWRQRRRDVGARWTMGNVTFHDRAGRSSDAVLERALRELTEVGARGTVTILSPGPVVRDGNQWLPQAMAFVVELAPGDLLDHPGLPAGGTQNQASI